MIFGPDTDWSEALSGVDAVVHLAARVHVMSGIRKGKAVKRGKKAGGKISERLSLNLGIT